MRARSRHRVHVITMGCAKNVVDSEKLLAQLRLSNIELAPTIDQPDVAVVNTCGFIGQAKEESVDALVEQVRRKSDGLLKKVFDVFWHQNPQQGIHLIKGEYKGEGPWKVGKNVIHVLGCHGSDPDLANLFAEWQYYLQTSIDEYPSADEIRSLAKARGALI